MTLSRTDPFAALLDVIDRRMAQFGPDQTAVMGTYDSGSDIVVLDSGQIIPHPVRSGSVSDGRYPCMWAQGGHDLIVLGPQPVDDSISFSFYGGYIDTDGSGSFEIPAGYHFMDLDVVGAGAPFTPAFAPPGFGARVTATFAVTPGQVYYAVPGSWGEFSTVPTHGGIGGFNGGGDGGATLASGNSGWGGCGASDLRFGGTGLADRILVAGGAGGQSFDNLSWSPGAGGTPDGGGGGGGGATQIAGGAAGGGGATAGVLGVGGRGSDGNGGAPDGGGGGGGGYYGGGGGAPGGATSNTGGGGSSWVDSAAMSVVYAAATSGSVGVVVATLRKH